MLPTLPRAIAGASLSFLLTACATTTPTYLAGARQAYDASSTGLAATKTPTDLYEAKKALDVANREYATNGDSYKVADYSYVAFRKVELADIRARTIQSDERSKELDRLGVATRDAQVASTTAALAVTREELAGVREQDSDDRQASAATNSLLAAANTQQGRQLADARTATTALTAANAAQGRQLDSERADNTSLTEKNSAQGRALVTSAAALETEKQARELAEKKLAGAMKDLATIAAIKEEARGVVITLSGAVLFASGQYGLLETAKTKLLQVSAALKAQNENRQMVVEGHTDAQGSDATNQPLSLNRARAVRDFLVADGVVANRITAVGLGSSRPLVANDNAENRANNRRVEIIVQPAKLSQR